MVPYFNEWGLFTKLTRVRYICIFVYIVIYFIHIIYMCFLRFITVNNINVLTSVDTWSSSSKRHTTNGSFTRFNIDIIYFRVYEIRNQLKSNSHITSWYFILTCNQSRNTLVYPNELSFYVLHWNLERFKSVSTKHLLCLKFNIGYTNSCYPT